jgi:Na+/melibiose symporter-like transporter
MYASAVPLGVAVVALFNPLVTGTLPLFAWLMVGAIVTRFSMALYHVPHLAIAAEVTTDFDERTSLVAYRYMFGSLGTLAAYGIGFGIYFRSTAAYANGQLNPEAYLPFTVVVGAMMATAILISALGTRSLIPHLPRPSHAEPYRIGRALTDLEFALANRSFRWLVIGFITVLLAAGVSGALALYVQTFFWSLTPAQIPLILGTGVVATIVGFSLSTPLTRRFDKRGALIIGAVIWAVVQAVLIGMGLLGLVPARVEATLALLMVGGLIQGAGGAQVWVASASMLADVADEHELATGKRQEGIFFGAFSFSQKAAQGAGVVIGGSLLDLIQWPTGAHVRTAADIPPEVLSTLAWIYGPGLAALMIPAIWCVRRYALGREAHAKIRAALEAAS